MSHYYCTTTTTNSWVVVVVVEHCVIRGRFIVAVMISIAQGVLEHRYKRTTINTMNVQVLSVLQKARLLGL
jgi:hypothetical protein